MVKNALKKNIKPIIGLAAVGVGLGVGASVIERAGGDASGLQSLSGFLPVAGTVLGAKLLYDITDEAFKLKKFGGKKNEL